MAMPESTLEELQRQLDGAILRLLGATASRFRLFRDAPVKREAVCTARGRDRRGADLQSSVPCGMFRRMQVAAQRQDADAPAPVRNLPDDGVCVTVVSEFGFEHQRKYASGAELGKAVLQELAAPAALVANARVGTDGTLYFVSRLFMERQRGLGKLLCTACGVFSASEKGLRHHQQIVHGTSYEESKDFAELAKHHQLAAVDTSNPVVAQALQRARQNAEAEAARARAARATLDPGLAAARDGDLMALKALVSDGWAATTPDRYGSCALQWAAGAGHLAVVRWLVEDCGLDPRTTTQPKDGRNALHWACRNGKLKVCRWLVENGRVDPSAPTKDGTSPFHWAVWQGHVDVCAWLVEIGADWRAKNSFGCNAVQWAALSGSVPMCRWLQNIGLRLDLLNHNGHSALHKAAVKGQQAVCTWLLSPDGGGLGAQHMLPDGDGNTPAEMARLEGYKELGSWLEAEAARMIRANVLTRRQHEETEAEDQMLQIDSQGRTPVHHAAKVGSTELLDRVAVIELQRADRFGRSAVHYAAQADNVPDGKEECALAVCCRRLKETGDVAILAADTAGCTALHYAAMQPTPELVRVLLSMSRAIYMSLLAAQDRSGKTALHYAAERGCASSIESMATCCQQDRDNKAGMIGLTQTDRAGRTPLHFGAQRGQEGESVVLACLSVAGGVGVASGGKVDRSGKTPLHLLAEHSTTNCVQKILDTMIAHQMAVEELCIAVDEKRCTPLHYAARNHDSRVMIAIAAHCQCQIGLAQLLSSGFDTSGQLPVHHAARFSSAGGIMACVELMDRTATEDREHSNKLSNKLSKLSAARHQLLTADRFGRLALHYAASASGTYKRKAKLKQIHRVGTHCASASSSPRAAAVSACLIVDPEIARAQVLYGDDKGKIPAFYAADLEHPDALEAMLAVGVGEVGDTAAEQLGHLDRDGRCLVHFAARRRTPAALRACMHALPSISLGKEADICNFANALQVRDRYGKTPANYASTDTVKAVLNEILLRSTRGCESSQISSSEEAAANIAGGATMNVNDVTGFQVVDGTDATSTFRADEDITELNQSGRHEDASIHVRRPQADSTAHRGKCPWDNPGSIVADAAANKNAAGVLDCLPVDGQTQILQKSDRGNAFADFLLRTFGVATLAAGTGVLDIAGGKGELSRALQQRGVPSMIVDPMSGGCDDGFDILDVEAKSERRQLRVAFDWQFGDTHSDVLKKSSCLVGLHPDQPTGAIIEVALAHQKPFAVVPCCVFSSQFPERTLSGKLVRQTEELVTWLCEQVRAAGRRPQVATLPIRGRNTVVFGTLH